MNAINSTLPPLETPRPKIIARPVPPPIEKKTTTPASIENHLDDDEPRWFAIRTKYKHEKSALKQLEQKQIETYLPIRTFIRKYNHKLRQVEMPLINSFVFVRIKKAQYVPVLETDYVAGFLKFGANILSIPDSQIKMLRRLLGENIEVVATQEHFQKGDWVEVTHGTLIGLQGQLIMVKGKQMVMVELINSGHSLQIDIDNTLLKKINVVG